VRAWEEGNGFQDLGERGRKKHRDFEALLV